MAAPLLPGVRSRLFKTRKRPGRGSLIAFQSNSREEMMEEGRKFEELAGRSFCENRCQVSRRLQSGWERL
jgi:hypothetical protein